MVSHQRRGAIFLTEKGRKLAESEKGRLEVIVRFLTDCLVLNKEVAKRSALKILFELDEVVSKRLYKFIEFMTLCPAKPVFIDKFEEYIREGKYEMCTYCPILMEKDKGGKRDGK